MTRKIISFIAALAAFLFFPAVTAKADLSITPVRVVFEARGRSAIIELINMTNRTNTYRMSWLMMKPTENGKYEMLPAGNEKDPHTVPNMIIFTPRQVTIEPKGHQVIRLSLRRPADLPPGEYRAHLTMTRLANDEKQREQDPAQKDMSMALNVNLGFSIPVIVRSGEDKDLRVSLTSPKLGLSPNKKTPVLDVDLKRDAGKFSSYGTLKVFWQPLKGAEQEVGTLDNVALYPELKHRPLSVPLKENPTSGSIKVVYLGKYESEGKTWAEKTFPIGK